MSFEAGRFLTQVTPQRVEEEIRRLSRRVEQRADELVGLFQAAGEAEVAYRVEHSKALLRSDKPTVAEREADATVQCERLLLDRKCKEAVADAAKESCRALRDQLNAVQTIASNMRSEMMLAGRTA